MRLLRTILLIGLSMCAGTAMARNGKDVFLAHRAMQFAKADIRFPDSVRVWGFGALHGSAETERAELILLAKLLDSRDSVWYFPETDFSTAYYFGEYLRRGSDSLLQQLIIHYGMRVPQERTVEVYEKWRILRELARGKCLHVIGIDPVCSPEFAIRYLTEMMQDRAWTFRDSLLRMTDDPNSESRSLFADLADDYAQNSSYYAAHVTDTASFGHVIRDLRRMGERREQAMVRNYRELDARYGFRDRPQFVRMGVGHILKEEQDGWYSFFSQLVQLGLYRRSEIYTIQGFLTQSRVVWDEKIDDKGDYSGCTTKGDWGISDSWRERFRGIRHLKRNGKGDLTFFDLHDADSPYAQPACLDLVVCRRPFGRSERCPEEACTLDYLDAAVLIQESKASRPIYELKTK